jgi:hypothetical protein
MRNLYHALMRHLPTEVLFLGCPAFPVKPSRKGHFDLGLFKIQRIVTFLGDSKGRVLWAEQTPLVAPRGDAECFARQLPTVSKVQLSIPSTAIASIAAIATATWR